MRTSIVLLVCLVAAACGGSQQTAASQAYNTGSWDSLTPAQRKEKMRTVVLPKMSRLFHDFDPQRFSNVTCGTCHRCTRSGQTGYVQIDCVSCHKPDGIPDKPAMPSKALPKLAVADGFKLHKEKAPKTLAFMQETVVPEMAQILGEPRYDPATQKGFGCFNCHTKAD